MARKYYTLAERIDGRWHPQFGDYDREVVADERRDILAGYSSDTLKACDLKIVTSGPKQADILAAIAKLNAK